MEETRIGTGVNVGAAEEKEGYWYFDSVATPLFNEEIGPGVCGRKPVSYALFGQLFLAPMMLPHHRRDRGRMESETEIFRRQRAFLEEYAALLREIGDVEGQRPGQRARELVHKLAENGSGSAQLDTERHRTRTSQSYAVKSSSYATPERYLSFYRFLERDGEAGAVERIRAVEELYRLELDLIFRNHRNTLGARLRFLLCRLPEGGAFAVEGGEEAAEAAILDGAGRILSFALLWAAAQRVNDWEVYELLHRRFGMPVPASTGIAGRSVPTSAQIPFSDIAELCTSVCRGEGSLTPREARALLRLLERFPCGAAAGSLQALLEAVSQARKLAYARVKDEEEREARRQLCALAGELDQMEGDIEARLREQQEG